MNDVIMARAHIMSKTVPLALILFLAWPDANAFADAYAEARAEMLGAYQQADFVAMREAAGKALVARPGFPGALFNLALAQVLDDDPVASLATLRDLLAVGADFNIADIAEFAPLRELLEWGDYAAAVKRLYEPVGFAEVVATLDRPDFIPEGIAADSYGRFYLGSIRHGELVRLGDDTDILSTSANGHWSVFGMRFDGKGGLWFTTAGVPQFEGIGDDLGKTGVFRLDLDRRTISEYALLPESGEEQVLGDLVLARNGIVYTTDSLTGVVYAYKPGNATFEILVDRGVFGSPQGLVFDAAEEHLYIADYIGGLYRVALDNGRAEKMVISANVTDYGIDGLYRSGDELIVIQNGIRPHRVVGLKLSEDGRSVVDARTLASNLAEFDEPTLGFVRGKDFYFVANSHWNRFDRDNRLPDGLSGPIILRIPLDVN